MRRRGLTSLLAVLNLAAVGCNWQDVDKDSQNTPVLSLGAPGNFGTRDDFGRIVIPIAAPSENDGVASRFLVSGATGTALALVELGPAGKAIATNIASPVFTGPNKTDGFPLNAIAEIPGPKPGKVLAAAKAIQNGSTVIYTATLGGTFDGTVFLASGDEAWLGIGVAAGDLKVGDPTLPEYVVASTDHLHVYVDGKVDSPLTWPAGDSTDCPVVLPGMNDTSKIPLNRPILVGHFWGPGVDPQIAISNFGMHSAGMASIQGTVSFLGVSATGLSCLGTITGAEEYFGQAIAVGDFNGDLKTDLIVGAPPQNAYVFLGPLTGAPLGIKLQSDPAVATQFGASVGSINLDGAGPDLAIVGDPSAAVSGNLGAGMAQLYSLGGSAPTVTTGMLLAAHDPAANAAYGASVTGLPFCGTCVTGSAPRIPVVGAGGRVLTYFTLGKTDLRMKP
ncbi:MAG TPA: FG-GAP repeat protein [Polyangia bacterium]|jgi:hypothetical protein|nr:FG-GAP repeat protein [Polyangia bacterium]